MNRLGSLLCGKQASASALDPCVAVPKAQTSGAHDGSALTGLEARVQLVNDVDATLAANQTVFAVTGLQRLKRIFDLHFSDPQFRRIEFAGL
jgi:hypothetical protein